jgi:hypothetical protein
MRGQSVALGYPSLGAPPGSAEVMGKALVINASCQITIDSSAGQGIGILLK